MGGLTATVDHATMWYIANEREGRKAAAEGVEIYFGDRLVGSETSEMDPRGPLLNHCRTDQIINAGRSPGQGIGDLTACTYVCPVPFSCWWIVVGPPSRSDPLAAGGLPAGPVAHMRPSCQSCCDASDAAYAGLCHLKPCAVSRICISNTGEAFFPSCPGGCVPCECIRSTVGSQAGLHVCTPFYEGRRVGIRPDCGVPPATPGSSVSAIAPAAPRGRQVKEEGAGR